ncbi:MAG TPA: lysine--tRNA ligase [Bacillota bacterium]|nr:lysine--tRNA ligase [Bacillota bacterium]
MQEKNQNQEINENEELSEVELQEQMQVRVDKLHDLVAKGNDPFEEITFDVTHHSTDITEHFEELENATVSVAGRLLSRRGMGKVSFCDLHDRLGRIQIFTKIDAIGEEAYADWQKLDIGDIVGVTGEVFRTRTGEISIRTSSYTLLAKALRPLPNKFHGLKDTELRYRQRYVDLIINPEVRSTFEKRSKVISEIRHFMDDLSFIEVETPILNTIPGGASARPFVTHHNTLDIDMYMRIAPELYLKRLIVGGFERVYEIGRLFRNEGMDVKHNPEFTTIECYQAFTDLRGMMKLTEDLIANCCRKVLGTTEITYQGTAINLTPPFARMTMTEAVAKYSGVDFSKITTDEEAFAAAKEKGIEPEAHLRKGEILNLFFDVYVEENLVQPTFICDYPIEISPLTKKKPDDPMLTDRFELFIGGREYANAYSELNDPIDQRARFADQLKKREQGDDEANLIDEDFCMSLEYGMPPTGGMGMGIDRLVMLLTDSASIRDVLLFPTMKSLDK